jgi:heptosyltransferase-2
MNLSREKRILSVSLGGLGDFITTMPILSALAAEACESITCLVWPALEDFASIVPYAGRVVSLPRDRENDPALSLFIRQLAGMRGFDLVLDFAFPPRAAIITRAAAGKRTMGFGLDAGAFPWYTDIIPNIAGEHRLERNFHLLERLDIDLPSSPDFSVAIPREVQARVDLLISSHGIDLQRDRLIGLHPGSGVSKRNWPPERFAELADRLIEHSGKKVVLLGGKQRTYDLTDESGVVSAVQSNMRREAISLAGRLSLPELTAFLSRCSLFVGNNSGPAHLAATVARVPSLLIWAPRNEKVWHPASRMAELVFAEPDCSQNCLLNKCDRIDHCLGLITVDQVYERYLEVFETLDITTPAGRGKR